MLHRQEFLFMYIEPGSFEEVAFYTGEIVLIVGAFALVAYIGVNIYSRWKDTKFF